MITVCTCTLGDTRDRLRLFMRELRAFTSVPFRHVVVDDGTESHHARQRQQEACREYGAEWLTNPGPTYGISYAWNHALDQVTTPWAYCVEDGLRPGMGWLEVASEFVERIGSKSWGGRTVGMAGFAHIQDWMLALGHAWPGGRDVMDVFRGDNRDFVKEGWNDGYWCWKRMLPGMMRSCNSPAARGWQNDVAIFRDIATGSVADLMTKHHPMDVEQAWQKWRTTDHWPARRGAWCGWYPGAFMLVNMDAWRKVGKFRDGVTFFEGHLGVRMGMAGYLSLCVEGPPWLHTPSLGFKATEWGKMPRHHEDTTKAFLRDFSHDSLDAPNVLASGVVTIDEQTAINHELAAIELSLTKGWGAWI